MLCKAIDEISKIPLGPRGRAPRHGHHSLAVQLIEAKDARWNPSSFKVDAKLPVYNIRYIISHIKSNT